MSAYKNLCRILRISSFLSFLVLFTVLPNIHATLETAIAISSYGTIRYDNVVPLLGGWGGIRIYETMRATNVENGSKRSTPPSIVFPGEVASNAELTCLEIKRMGYNTVRFMWKPATSPKHFTWKYNETWMGRAIQIAKALNMWIIIDCHGYSDHYQYEDEWINEWYEVILKFKDSYDKIVWEPINEPVMQWTDGSNKLTGEVAVNELARIYQRWINMCRSLGDTHWIVVSHLCWYDPEPWQFPIVYDPLNRIFLNAHYYIFYQYNQNNWTIEWAQQKADKRFNKIVEIINTHKRPFISTEMGPQPFTPGYDENVVPDAQYGGASGYSIVSLAYIQRLIKYFDSYPGRIGYILWTAGDWGKDWEDGWHYGGLYGGMDIWGCLLEYAPFE